MTTADTIGAMTAEEIVALTKRHSIFSWSAQASVNPIPMVRGEGIYWSHSAAIFPCSTPLGITEVITSCALLAASATRACAQRLSASQR